jgi:hypothetical protein
VQLEPMKINEKDEGSKRSYSKRIALLGAA